MFALNLNLKNRAATQFMAYPFNSFCLFKGRRLAAGPSGLFTIGGDDDNGEDIQAFFETVLSDWGAIQVKRPRFCFVSFLEGPLELSVVNGDETVSAMVEIPSTTDDLPEIKQVSVPRTTAQRLWKFKFANVDGSKFGVDGLSVFFVVRPHGLSKSV